MRNNAGGFLGIQFSCYITDAAGKKMNQLILEKKTEIESLCKQFHVKRLDLFGSATTNAFDSEKSDVDFLVVFDDMEPSEHANAYFGLLSALKDLFERHVDLVELKAIDNPYFLEAVEESRTVLYAA